MYKGYKIGVIIPALNEAESLPLVLRAIPDFADTVIVADNGSKDGTGIAALNSGSALNVAVCREEKRGYGNACMKAMTLLRDEEIIVFLDGDYSDHPEMMAELLDPIAETGADTVISNRIHSGSEKGSLTLVQKYGNILSVLLVRLFWGFAFYDLGPFRSITAEVLKDLQMKEPAYGWTAELQVKAVQKGLKIAQVNLPYKKRLKGHSKVSGTIRGSVLAGAAILWTILKGRMFGRNWERKKIKS